jgi:hypothetical protein
MIERCKDLAFLAKPLQYFAVFLFGVNDFDGHLLAIRAIGALRQIDGAHAAAPDLPDQLVATQLATLHTGRGFDHGIEDPSRRAKERFREPFRQALPRAQETLYLLAEVFIGLAFPLQKGLPGRRVELHCGFIHSSNSTKAFRRHRTSLGHMLPFCLARRGLKTAH